MVSLSMTYKIIVWDTLILKILAQSDLDQVFDSLYKHIR